LLGLLPAEGGGLMAGATETLQSLERVVLEEAIKVAAAAPFVISAGDDLCLAVRALQRHRGRIAELERRLDEETSRR
jgi:hypothetical protein